MSDVRKLRVGLDKLCQHDFGNNMVAERIVNYAEIIGKNKNRHNLARVTFTP